MACLRLRRDRLAAETFQEREARLQQRRDRLAAETSQERQARLQQRKDRLAAETSQERKIRLQLLRTSWYIRLVTESAEERGTVTADEHSPA